MSTVAVLRKEARADLADIARAARKLERRVYFVPGITDEDGASAWGDASDGTDSMKRWLPACVPNAADTVRWITFPGEQPGRKYADYPNFVAFGNRVARFIHDDMAGSADECDIVCHSMGGLDAAAAIALLDLYDHTYDQPPVRGVRNIVTFDTPFLGSVNAGSAVFKAIKQFQGRTESSMIAQAVAMQPDSPFIGLLGQQRDRFLRNVGAFWPRGASHFGGLIEVTHESAMFDGRASFSAPYRSRYQDYLEFSATEHAGPTGVTRDPRAIRDLLTILLDGEAWRP